jgi:hypothetical protein
MRAVGPIQQQALVPGGVHVLDRVSRHRLLARPVGVLDRQGERPAIGRKSRRTWRGLVFLGRVQFWVALSQLAGLVLWWTYAT